MQIDNFGSSCELFEHYALLAGDSSLDVEAMARQHAHMVGFQSLEEYVTYLDSAENQVPQLTFAFAGREIADITVELTNVKGDITRDPHSFDVDLNEAVSFCLTSSRWGGTKLAFKTLDVVQALIPYLSDAHYELHPQLLADREKWTGAALFFDASFKNVIAEHNSPNFAFTVTHWLGSSADLAFPESTNPVQQMVDFSDQLLGNAAAHALEVMMGYLRNNDQVKIQTADDLRRELMASLTDSNIQRIAVSTISGLYLSFLSVPMTDDEAEAMVQTALKEEKPKLSLVHSSDSKVRH